MTIFDPDRGGKRYTSLMDFAPNSKGKAYGQLIFSKNQIENLLDIFIKKFNRILLSQIA